jgi:glycolate oxidase FAD binding subunit
VRARGTRQLLGRPVKAANVLDVSALSGIVSYEPAELVLTARAGTPMQDIEAALAEHAQCMAFEPPNLAALLGSHEAASGSLGGVIATGLSGPRRFKAGAARDHVLGIAAVSGRGEAFVGGGKVVKNVTGYDLPKLMTGSYGTLAVLTEITIKVLPRPQDVATLLVTGPGLRDAIRIMTGVLQTAVDVSGACHLPVGITLPGKAVDAPVTAFRVEGFSPSVVARMRMLWDIVHTEGSLSTLDFDASIAFWHAVRDVSPFADSSVGLLWRVSVPPASAAAVVERIEKIIPGAKVIVDWGGGLIWVGSGQATRVREALGDAGGHATLIRAPLIVRADVDVFQPQAREVAALSRRVKAQFDPAGVLNPGRMYADS